MKEHRPTPEDAAAIRATLWLVLAALAVWLIL